MKAYLAIKYHPGGANRARIERVCAVLEAAGIESVCVIRDLEQWGQMHFEPDELMRRSFELLEGCDLLLVELTEKGVGVGIEAGYAHAKGIPVVTIAEAGADISETLRGISREVLKYKQAQNWLNSAPDFEFVNPRLPQSSKNISWPPRTEGGLQPDRFIWPGAASGIGLCYFPNTLILPLHEF